MNKENRTSIIVCYSRKDAIDIIKRMHHRRLVANCKQTEFFIKDYFENWKIVPVKNHNSEDLHQRLRGCIFKNAYFDKFCYSEEYEKILRGRRVEKILTVEDLLNGEL